MKLHRYVAHQRLHIVTKDRHSYLSLSYPPLIDLSIGFFTFSFFYYMEYLNENSQIC